MIKRNSIGMQIYYHEGLLTFVFFYFEATSYTHLVWVSPKVDCLFVEFIKRTLKTCIRRRQNSLKLPYREFFFDFGTVSLTIQPHFSQLGFPVYQECVSPLL